MDDSAVLSIQDLSCDFLTIEGIVYALSHVNLDVKRGEIHGLVGESGCGKSITARAVLGLLDKTRSRVRGTALFGGMNLLVESEKRLRSVRGRRISMIFQDPLNSLSPLETVGSQIEEAISNHLDLSAEERRKRVAGLLEKVGLGAETAKQYPFELSGGMQQRVMIAQAISCEPELLIADEPTTALDVTIQAQVLRLIRELRSELSLSVLLITHSFAVVAENCDRVSVMYSGRVVETAPARALIDQPAHPYSRALIDCIPSGASTRGGRAPLPVIPGFPPKLYEPPAACPFAPRCARVGERCTTLPAKVTLGAERSVLCHYPLVSAGGAHD